MSEYGDSSERGAKRGLISMDNERRPARPYRCGRHGQFLGAAPASAKARRERLLRQANPQIASWASFVEKFEKFTHILCSAAQYGANPALELEYDGLRTWLLAHYYDHAATIRSRMGDDIFEPHAAGDDAAVRMDRFEAIFLPRTIQELLAHDDGTLISLISQISHAVYSVEPVA